MADIIFKRTGILSRLILRRDRFRIPVWLIGIGFFTFIVPVAFTELYGTQAQRDIMAQTMKNPAMIAMVGTHDLTHYTLGVMTAHQMLLMTAVVVALMSILLVTRHTREEEENGRIELIRSLPVGRLSSLNAALFVYTGVHILLALLIGFGLYALNLESMDLEGSVLYGVALGATGIFFAGVTAFFAQLCESSRGTIGFSIAILLISYIVRGIGDVSNPALSWFSPLGWLSKAEVYGSNNWWPIGLMIGISLILFFLASYLNASRDLESGLLPSKPGRKHASALLQSPIGLGLRLQRTGIISWAVGMFLIGVSYGSVLGDLDSFFEGNDLMKQMLSSSKSHTFTEQFMSMIMMISAIIASIPAVMSMNKLYGEEKKGRIEHLLVRAISRTKLLGSYLVISIINGFVMLSVASIGMWFASLAVLDVSLSFRKVYGMGLVYYPALLVMISVAVLFIGYLPRFTSFIWLYVFYTFIVLYMGGLFQLDDWFGNLSPFGHIPQLPIEKLTWAPMITLVGIAVIISAIGIIGYKRRDITG
ncbi:ABC transporter permease [Lysinibacillus sp. SGAir0095]|uniref:ABC transporter permease n=1 Tax=Lysinibacillus sp. SGAir0095 TaxID=2070463 RepID=UPI0010CCBA15|nr:ABC transporter permease [Lysinibacillus sp. SGAir0095]QCR33714.1 ABC transporter permease [Lysinibacillus sp. SGAir0095]